MAVTINGSGQIINQVVQGTSTTNTTTTSATFVTKNQY